MKNVTLLLIFLMAGFNLLAQEEEKEEKNRNPQEYKTLFGSDEMSHGGYGALSFNYSQIDGNDAILVGARGAWVINHGLALGIAGYGFANDNTYSRTINGYTSNYSLAGGYGGLLIEPIIGAKKPVHVSFPILIGAGGISYVNQYYGGSYDPYYPSYYNEADAFFVLEPGVEVEFNMVKFMRIGLGVYYRYTSNLDMVDTDKDILHGFSAGLTMKFGKF